MLTFYNEKGEGFGAQVEFTVKNAVNGERSVSGTIISNDRVLSKIDRGWKFEFDGEFYNIVYAKPRDEGRNLSVSFDAVHQFFYDFGHSNCYTEFNGSHRFEVYIEAIFKDSGYRYQIEPRVRVNSIRKENFGNSKRLEMFKDIIKAAGLEFSVSGKVVLITKKIGADLSTVVRKNFNMNELVIEKNINKFITYKRGLGAWKDEEDHSKGRYTTEYESPLASIYGRIEGEPVTDERYKDTGQLLRRLKFEVDNSYSISVQLDMEDLTRAGYQYTQPRAGDYIMAINEMIGFWEKIRIVSFESSYDVTGRLINHKVTCNDIGSVQKQISSEGSIIRNVGQSKEYAESALAVATKALASADGKNTVYYGATKPKDEPIGTIHRGDILYLTAGEDTEMYIWNGAEWELRKLKLDTAELEKEFDKVKKAAEQASEENKRRSDEALKKAGASEDLAKEAKRIGLDSVAKLEEFKRQATSAQTALSGDLDVFKRTVTNEVNQASEYRRTTTEALSRMTGQMDGFASKSEVKQGIDGLTQTFAKMKVGGTNLLKGSKGPFMPDIKPANFDNNILYVENTSIYMERGQEYIISAKTDGNFTNNHDWSKESDNVVLWIMGKKLRPYQIVSDLNTGTTGTKIIWNKPTGIYHLRVNTYHKEATKSVWDVKIEKGNIATDWSPAIEDVESQITEARTEFKQTADGLSTKMATVESYIGQDGQRQESLQRYAREESAKQATAVRELVSRDFVGKATYQEDVKGLERRFSAISTQTNNDIATKIAQYKQTVDGQFASITSQIAGKVNNVDFQRVRETAKLHERILGTSETGAPDKLSRLVMSSEIFQTEVGKYVTDDNNLIVNSETMDKHVLVNPRQGNNIFVNGGVFTIKAQGLTSHNWSGFTLPIYVRKIYKGETYSLGFKYRIRGALDFGFNVTVKKHSQNRSIFTGIVGRSNSPVSDEWKDFQGTFYMPSDFEFGNDKIFPFYCYVTRNGWVEIKEIMLVRGSNTGPYKPSQFDDAYKQTKEAKDLAENAQAKAIEVAEKARQAQQTAEATRTQVTQLAGSWSVQNINSAGDLISGINLGADGRNRLIGKTFHITGETLIDNAVIKDGMIANVSANKLTAGTIDANTVNLINLNANNVTSGTFRGLTFEGGIIRGNNGNTVINLNDNVTTYNGYAKIEFKSPGNSLEFNSGGRKAFLTPTIAQGTSYAAFAFGVNDRGDNDPNRDFVGLKIFNQPGVRKIDIIGDLTLTRYEEHGIKSTSLQKLFELINDNFKRLREFRVENGEGSPGFWDVSI